MTESIELRFHRVDRTSTRVGTMKNGAGVYRLTTIKGTRVYLVRRKAKSETAKGYSQATEITLAQMESTVFTDAAAQAQAASEFRHSAERCRKRAVGNQAWIDRQQNEMTKLLAAGEEGIATGKDGSLYHRAMGEPTAGSEPFTTQYEYGSMWTEEYRNAPNHYGGKPRNQWLPEGWKTVTRTIKSQGFFDAENTKLEKDSIRWDAAADRLAA